MGVGRNMDLMVQPSWNVIPKERANPLGIIPEKPANDAVPWECSRPVRKTSPSQVTDKIFDPENIVSGSRSTSEVTLSEVLCQKFPAKDVDA